MNGAQVVLKSQCPYPKRLAQSPKGDSFKGQMLKIENPLRLTAIVLYILIKKSKIYSKKSSVYLIQRKVRIYMTDTLLFNFYST